MHNQPNTFTASLEDLLLRRTRDTDNVPPPQHREDSSSSPPALKAALQRATAWLDGAARPAPDTLEFAPPHADLASVATALAAARGSPDAAQVLASACQPLAAATLQLARAASATAAAAAAAAPESSGVAGAAAAGAEQLKAQLSWACHLTTALHTFISTSQAAPAPAAAATKRQAGRRAAPTPPPPPPSPDASAAADAYASAPPAHHLPSKLQERWQQAVLPGILQHLHACYQHLLQPSEATTQQPLLTTKERAAADKLLHGVCIHLLSSTATTAGSSKPRKPPAKQPRKATTSPGGNSNHMSDASRQQCCALLGCHLLFSHSHQLQQQAPQRAQQPGGAQAGPHWRWCAEVCSMMGDGGNVCLQQAVPAALMSLVAAPSTRAAACQMLCAAAAAAFPGAGSSGHGQQQQQQRSKASSKKPALPAAAAAGTSGLLLLELLSTLLAAAWSWPDVSSSESQKQLLAAAVLPVLQPAGGHTNPPAARKHVLSIAAAAGTVPAGAGACGHAAAAAAAAWTALAAAAQGDKDATVRAKALALLAELAPTMLRQWGSWHAAGSAVAGQAQQQEGQDGTAAAGTNTQGTPPPAAAVLEGAASSMAAVLAAVQEQLGGSSSKSCRLKALHLLQQLLVQTPASGPWSRAAAGTVTAAITQLQQRCAVLAFPGVCSILAAGQDSRLHCPSCKAAAELVLQAVAAALEPQQALQLALSCGAGSSDDGCVSPAGRLLVALSGCSGQQLHTLLRQQLVATELTSQRQQLVQQLQPLAKQQPQGLEGLRRHAFAVVCQALMAAADAGDSTGSAAEEQDGTAVGCQRELLLAVQLLQIAGGCSGAGGDDDLRGELGILGDALDLCGVWLQQALDDDEKQHGSGQGSGPGGDDQLPPASGFAVCHELLGSLLAILDAAADGAREASASASSGNGPLKRRSHEWLWDSIGSCCMHHLSLITCLASRGDSPVRLPLGVLDTFLRVLCHANRGQQLLLHDLLRRWHSDLTAPAVTAAAAGQHTACTVQLGAFLLLLKHLGGLYAIFRVEAARALGRSCEQQQPGPQEQQPGPREQQPDQQQQPSVDYMLGEEEAAAREAATARLTDTLLQETAPACYAPLLLQLTQAAAAPVHIRVLALQALQPLLLVSAAFSQQHSDVIASILSSATAAAAAPPPAPLLVQAVATAGALIEARPSSSTELVVLLEHVMLSEMMAGRGSAASDATTVDGGGGPPATAAAACQAGSAAAAVTAARCYCRLLMGSQLLLTGRSWGVVAAGLLASGQLQGVALVMRQLVAGLISQRHVPRPAAALGLLLNLPQPPVSANAERPNSAAQQLVEQHLLAWVLRPEDLASEALCMPLLQSLSMGLSSSSSSGMLAATARLLAACTPAGRCRQACLDGLLRTCQAHKHSLACSCPRDVLVHLTGFVKAVTSSSSLGGASNSKAAASAARPSRAAAAAASSSEGDGAGGPAASTAAATQAKLLALLQNIGAGSSRRVDDVQAGGGATASGAGDSGSDGSEEEEEAATPPVAQPPGSASAAVSLKKRARAPLSGQDQAQELQALLLVRQRDVQVLKGKK